MTLLQTRDKLDKMVVLYLVLAELSSVLSIYKQSSPMRCLRCQSFDGSPISRSETACQLLLNDS